MRLLCRYRRAAQQPSASTPTRADEKAQQESSVWPSCCLARRMVRCRSAFRGPYDAGRAISTNRANAVKTALIQAGGQVLNAAKVVTKAYGKLMPVACNDTDAPAQPAWRFGCGISGGGIRHFLASQRPAENPHCGDSMKQIFHLVNAGFSPALSASTFNNLSPTAMVRLAVGMHMRVSIRRR
jgi:hypothetical protein